MSEKMCSNCLHQEQPLRHPNCSACLNSTTRTLEGWVPVTVTTEKPMCIVPEVIAASALAAAAVPAPVQAGALPTTAAARKAVPLFSGVLNYFPDALAAVAELSRVGNDQHNPGKPLFWDRSKSGDELDALTRHLLEAGTIDIDGIRHSAKVAWRALANLQKEIEKSKQP